MQDGWGAIAEVSLYIAGHVSRTFSEAGQFDCQLLQYSDVAVVTTTARIASTLPVSFCIFL